jgi:tetratricopeptide (TPR) repeat protein
MTIRLAKMTLRNRIRILATAPIVLWIVVEVWSSRLANLLGGWDLLSLFMAVLVAIGIANFVARRPFGRFRKALSVEDVTAARRELAILTDLWRARGGEVMKGYGIGILVLEGRYEDAINGLQALDLNKLGKKHSSVIIGQIAWCTAQLGNPAMAIEVITPVLPQLEYMGSQYSSGANLVFGTANFMLGKPDIAVSHLEKAYASAADSPSRKATAAFYLGEAYSSLGKPEEAKRAYSNAREVLPNGKFGKRALERLK